MIDFERLLQSLAPQHVEFVIVGGVAATIHGSARLTADLDVCTTVPPRTSVASSKR